MFQALRQPEQHAEYCNAKQDRQRVWHGLTPCKWRYNQGMELEGQPTPGPYVWAYSGKTYFDDNGVWRCKTDELEIVEPGTPEFCRGNCRWPSLVSLSTGMRIADAGGGEYCVTERDEDARLLMAAPDLLLAVLALQACPEIQGADVSPHTHRTIEQARRALDKALPVTA